MKKNFMNKFLLFPFPKLNVSIIFSIVKFLYQQILLICIGSNFFTPNLFSITPKKTKTFIEMTK